MKVDLTMQEMVLIRNNLQAVRVYRNTDIPHDVVLWYPWMERLLIKINNGIHHTELETSFEERAET